MECENCKRIADALESIQRQLSDTNGMVARLCDHLGVPFPPELAGSLEDARPAGPGGVLAQLEELRATGAADTPPAD